MNRIADLRTSKGINQIEMANLLKVSQGTLSNWERGVHDIDQNSMSFLADYFEVSIDFLLGRSDVNTYDKDELNYTGEITEHEKKLFERYQKAKDSDDPRDRAVAEAVEKLLGMDE